MNCKGNFIFKSLILRPAGKFLNADGKEVL